VDTRRTRAKPLSPQDRRAAIIAATRPLLIEHGERVTTRLIAEAAGIAEGTIFRVFADKRELFLAVAQDTVNPPGARERMQAKLRHVIDSLAAGAQRTLPVMIAVRSALAHEPHDHATKGPPTFLVEAHRALIDNLADLLFEPYAAQLRLPPAKAALVLRSLTIGTWMPGMPGSGHALAADDVIDVLLNGILEKGDD
jgi:AcrR family transcriptional regulator